MLFQCRQEFSSVSTPQSLSANIYYMMFSSASKPQTLSANVYIMFSSYFSDQGEGEKEIDMPHKITTWSVDAVEIDRDNGLCVAQPYDFKVIKKAFLKITMPYQAIRGEHINIRATFHNYDHDMEQVNQPSSLI